MTLMFVPPEVKVEPSLMPAGEDSQADEKVALARRIESNCMNASPDIRGLAERELNSMSTAMAIPELSAKGIGPL